MRLRISAFGFLAVLSVACADERIADAQPTAATPQGESATGENEAAASSNDGALAESALRSNAREAKRGRGGKYGCADPTQPLPSEPALGTPEPSEEPERCLFGEQFSDLRTHAELTVVDEHWITSVNQLLSELERAQLVLAVQQSSHVDVESAEEALSRVDQQEVRRMELNDAHGTPAFTVYEYGVGDNSYGAIFVYDTSELAANIHDGDLLNCQFQTASP